MKKYLKLAKDKFDTVVVASISQDMKHLETVKLVRISGQDKSGLEEVIEQMEEELNQDWRG